MQPQPQQQPQIVQPQPLPESWRVSVMASGIVMIEIFSPNGVHVSFMDADGAIDIGGQITSAGRQLKTGLIEVKTLPPNMQLPPNGHG